MNVPRFYINLALVSLISVVFLYFLSKIFSFEDYLDLGVITWVMFSIMAVVLFHIAKITVDNPKRTKFISLTIGNMFFKMILSVGIVLIYFKLKNPSSPLFIVPFLLIYILFTIFETYFLLTIANRKKI